MRHTAPSPTGGAVTGPLREGEDVATAPGPVGRRMSEAEPEYVAYPRPPAGAPNVVVVVLDDVGFAQLGCFGSQVATPHIDALAAGGLRYNRFHVTSICSSTRASLLSGRNHHAVGMGMTAETPLGFPGYTGRIPPSAALLPRILRDNGYSTFAVGKWHLCPKGEHSASGPMDRWPLGLGFERFYGFLGAETSQWAPELCRDNTFVDPPRTPAEGYHLSEDLADQAIRMVLDQQQASPEKPFFCYLATGAAHAPHQVPPAWSDAYQGRFDTGWEATRAAIFERQLAEGVVPPTTRLPPRPSWVQEWNALPRDERRLFARHMEVFAGFVTHADAQIGRFVDFLSERGVLDDTLLLVLSDNGASAEGSPTGTLNEPNAWMGQVEETSEGLARIDDIGGHRAFNHYPWGWAWAGNTPLRLWKRYAWLGGVRTPLVVHWPGHTEGSGAVRTQFCHAVDLLATVLDAAGIDVPDVVDGVTQQRVDGASLAETFADPTARSPRRTQYFEMHGSRAIYHDGWKATTDHVSAMFGERSLVSGSQDLDDDQWCLFHLDEDFSESEDLARLEPARAAAMAELWWGEAGRNQVLPLFEGPSSLSALHPGEFSPPEAASYTAGGGPICEAQLPPMAGGFSATAELDVPEGALAEGVICALGDLNGGWALYLLEGRPVACLVSSGQGTRLTAPEPIAAGRRTVSLRYLPGRGGGPNLFLLLDGVEVAQGDHGGLVMFPALSTAGGGLLVGRDRGLAVCEDYQPPFPLSGPLRSLVIRSERRSRRPAGEVAEHATRAD